MDLGHPGVRQHGTLRLQVFQGLQDIHGVAGLATQNHR
jgi:hypothetical protein